MCVEVSGRGRKTERGRKDVEQKGKQELDILGFYCHTEHSTVRTKPLDYLGWLVGQEGEGSILHHLMSR